MTHRNMYRLLCAVLVAVLCVSGWQIGRILLEYRAAERTYTEAAELSLPATGETAAKRNFEALRQQNPDIVAWLTIPGTAINYPVLQGQDNRYYLNHLVTGKQNPSGSIFLDCRVAADFRDGYNIVYGHNMLDGTMFSDLTDYSDPSFYSGHPTGTLETPDETLEVRFFAGIVADAQDPLWMDFRENDKFDDWLGQVRQRSCFDSPITPSAQDRLVALVTCNNLSGSERFVLFGILSPGTE